MGRREGGHTGGVPPTEGRAVRVAGRAVSGEGEVGGAERVVVVVLAAAVVMKLLLLLLLELLLLDALRALRSLHLLLVRLARRGVSRGVSRGVWLVRLAGACGCCCACWAPCARWRGCVWGC